MKNCQWSVVSSQLFSFSIFYFLFSISSFAQFTITPTIIDATCPADSNGSISVSVSGGTIPYTYLWSPGGQPTSAITGLSPGTYSVTITDNAVPVNDSTVSYVVGPFPILDNAEISCAIILSPTGGTAPFGFYGFNWSNGSASSFINIGAEQGNYSVIITDANNCTATFSYDVTSQCFVSPAPYFTPNDDVYGDNTWQIANAEYFDNIHLIVFNRWGTRVHEQRGTYEPWNGKSYLGIPVPVAVYYYFFYQEKDDKQKNAKSGSVTIMR